MPNRLPNEHIAMNGRWMRQSASLLSSVFISFFNNYYWLLVFIFVHFVYCSYSIVGPLSPRQAHCSSSPPPPPPGPPPSCQARPTRPACQARCIPPPPPHRPSPLPPPPSPHPRPIVNPPTPGPLLPHPRVVVPADPLSPTPSCSLSREKTKLCKTKAEIHASQTSRPEQWQHFDLYPTDI